MRLVDCLRKEAICMELPAQKRDDALRAMIEQLAEGGLLPSGLVEPVFEAVLARERLGSTAIGRGVAVPHARLEELDGIVVGFGYSSAGVEFRALDGEPVHEIFLVIASKDGAAEYLSVMEQVTRLVQNDDFRRFVAGARTAEEVMDLIVEMSGA